MGIVNVTPDSFSDGGRFGSAREAADAARAMLADGAALVDVGGESTRPGSDPVTPDEELRRVVPYRAATVQQLDPEGREPALRRMVVIGHSQGGLLTKLTAIDRSLATSTGRTKDSANSVAVDATMPAMPEAAKVA